MQMLVFSIQPSSIYEACFEKFKADGILIDKTVLCTHSLFSVVIAIP